MHTGFTAAASRAWQDSDPALAAAAGIVLDASVTGILSVLVFGAGTNYALLLIARYRDELRTRRFAPDPKGSRIDPRRRQARARHGGQMVDQVLALKTAQG